MADTFKIYKGATVAVSGPSPLAITKLAPGTAVKAGDYKAVRVVGGVESAKVDIPAFNVLPAPPAIPVIGAVTPTADGATVALT